MCEFVKAPNLAMGWGCCRCHVYNSIQRTECKECKIAHHEPLDIKGDCATGIYEEDGGVTNVEILALRADSDGVGLTLKSTGTEAHSRLVKDIPIGEIFDVWRKHNAGAYSGMWRLE